MELLAVLWAVTLKGALEFGILELPADRAVVLDGEAELDLV